MTKLPPITAILVGGRETRHLRVPKQTLPFGETTVLARTLNAYLGAGVSDVILVLGYKADQVASELGPIPANVRIVKNPLFDEGMASFLRSGVRELPSTASGFCIGLGDQPLLTSELIRELLEAFVAAKKSILVPAYQGSLGLPVFLKSALAEEILSLPPKGELWDVLKAHQEEMVDHPTRYTAVVRSIEDLDDYHTLLHIAGLEIPDLPAATHPEPAEEPLSAEPPDEIAGDEPADSSDEAENATPA